MSEVALAACPCDPGLPPQAGGSDGTISDNTTPVLSVIRKIDVQPRVIFWWSPEPGIPTLNKLVTLQNFEKNSLTAGQVVIEGPCTADYSIRNDNISFQTIAPGAEATLEVVFTPQSTGPRLATLAILFADPAIFPVYVELHGNYVFEPPPGEPLHPQYEGRGGTISDNTTPMPWSLMPKVIAEPPECAWYWIEVSASSPPVPITIINIGNCSVTTGQVATEGPCTADYSIRNDNISFRTIAPGAEATLEVVFTPQSTGPRLATLVIWITDPVLFPVASVDLYGNTLSDITTSASFGASNISIDHKIVNFGLVIVGSSKESPSIEVRNKGNDSLNISHVTIEGPDAADFSLQYDDAATQTIYPGRQVFLKILFRPSSTGAKSAILRIISDAQNEPVASVKLRGVASAVAKITPPVSPATTIPGPEPAPDWALLIGIIMGGVVLVFFIFLLLRMDI